MQRSYKPLIYALLVVLGVAFGLSKTGVVKFGSTLSTPGRASGQMGTYASPITLTNSFTDVNAASTTAMESRGMKNLAIGGTWKPKSHASVLYFQVLRSLDNGNTYLGINNTSSTLEDIGVNLTASTGSLGIPVKIPGDNVAVSGTEYKFSYDFYIPASDYIKVYAQESSTSTHGTSTIQVLLNN